jgi:hypothetical protein
MQSRIHSMPSLPASAPALFTPTQSGSAIDYLDKDVWWRGVVVNVAPAGASVFFPGGWGE